MSNPDFTKPGLGPLRATAEAADFTKAASGLAGAYGGHLTVSGTLAPLARAIARSMTEAGLTVHHCALHDPRCRLGGVCLLPVPAGPASDHAGVVLSWTTHALLLDWDRYGTRAVTQQAMNAAIGAILRAFGYAAEPFGSGGAWLVAGRPTQDPGAGR
jgi:hypothetical protein